MFSYTNNFLKEPEEQAGERTTQMPKSAVNKERGKKGEPAEATEFCRNQTQPHGDWVQLFKFRGQVSGGGVFLSAETFGINRRIRAMVEERPPQQGQA